jgi:hypothetical protein
MKALFTKKEIESYNKIAAYLNEQKDQVATTSLVDFEQENTNRIPCIRIVAGRTEKYNCKTGETIP